MRVIGIDPGYERLGIAVLESGPKQPEVLASACIKTKATLPFAERLLLLGQEFETWLKKWQPEIVATEKLFFTTNKKTALAVAEVRGVINFLAARRNLPVAEYTPLQVKQTVTGYGKADKSQVAQMVTKLLVLTKPIKHDDEFDAIAIGLTCLACYPQLSR